MEVVLAAVVCLAKMIQNQFLRNEKRKLCRRVWVETWIGGRTEYGAANALLKDLKNEDLAVYRNMLRFPGKQVDELTEMIHERKETELRESIPMLTKRRIALRFLATGDSFKNYHSLWCQSS